MWDKAFRFTTAGSVLTVPISEVSCHWRLRHLSLSPHSDSTNKSNRLHLDCCLRVIYQLV